MTINITDEDKRSFDLDIVTHSKEMWEGNLQETKEAITIEDLNKLLEKYLGI